MDLKIHEKSYNQNSELVVGSGEQLFTIVHLIQKIISSEMPAKGISPLLPGFCRSANPIPTTRALQGADSAHHITTGIITLITITLMFC